MWMKRKRGSSLIEVIIALSILMIITNMLAIVFSFTTKSYGKLKKHNERLNVVEFISKNLFNSYSYEDIHKLIVSETSNYKLILDSGTVNDDINTLSMDMIVKKYKNNSRGDIEVTFALDNHKGEIKTKISCNTYGNTIKDYEVIKRRYDN